MKGEGPLLIISRAAIVSTMMIARAGPTKLGTFIMDKTRIMIVTTTTVARERILNLYSLFLERSLIQVFDTIS